MFELQAAGRLRSEVIPVSDRDAVMFLHAVNKFILRERRTGLAPYLPA